MRHFRSAVCSCSTAWHCVTSNLDTTADLWFRFRHDTSGGRDYVYIPVRITNYDEKFDVAALAPDPRRFSDVGLNWTSASALLGAIAIPLGGDTRTNDATQLMGFPESATSADSDTNSAIVVDSHLPLGDVTALKLFGHAFAAVNPVNPHGLSGGPVLRIGMQC